VTGVQTCALPIFEEEEEPNTTQPELATGGFGNVQYVDIVNAIKDIFTQKK
jgi:hypothetical protein